MEDGESVFSPFATQVKASRAAKSFFKIKGFPFSGKEVNPLSYETRVSGTEKLFIEGKTGTGDSSGIVDKADPYPLNSQLIY